MLRRMSAPPRLASRFARILWWSVAGLALLLLTLWTVAYFALGATPVREGLVAALGLPEAVSVGALRWGPAPDTVAMGDVRVRRGDQVVLRVATAWADVELGALISGELVVDRVEAVIDGVEVVQDADGAFPLVAALTPKAKPPAVAGAAKKDKARLEVKALVVDVGAVWIDVADAQAEVRGLRIEGALDRDGGARFEARTGPCHASWNKGRRVIGFRECRVASRVDGQRLTVESLSLAQEEIVLEADAELDLKSLVGQWRAYGDLGPAEAAAIAGPSFPAGFAFDGLALTTDGGTAKGTLGQLMAAHWTSGPLSADHLALGSIAFTAEPGLLVPELAVTVDGIAAARLEGLGWGFEGVWLPRAEGDLEKKLVAATSGSAADWTMPSGHVGPIALSASAELKLTGGVIDVVVLPPEGIVRALGTLKSSPLTKRTSFVANLAFAGVTGPLAEALAHDVDVEQRAALGEPLAGTAEVDVEVDREDRFAPWVATLEWALGRLDGKIALSWDGYGWGAPTPEDAQAPDVEEEP
jgi:hypothetical protein